MNTIYTTSHVTDYAKRSDEMTEAPARIWAQKEAFADDWDAGTFCTVSDGGVGYIRADHVDAMLKAEREKALREAAEVCTNIIKNYDVMEPGKPDQFASLKTQKAAKGMVSLARQDILALISEDATKEPSSNP